MQKVEGNVSFHTAYSTAFVQPAPGKADSPGPDEGSRRPTTQSFGNHGRQLRTRKTRIGNRRFNPRVICAFFLQILFEEESRVMKRKMLVAIANAALPLALAALFIMHPPRVKGEDAKGTDFAYF
jgi:hypothetical protein